jgi:hypothetical protein
MLGGWRRRAVTILGAALVVASTLTVAGPASPAAAQPEPCGYPYDKNFYGAFYVWERGCATHDDDPLYYAPFLELELQSPQPWRFTDCTIHWAYKTALDGVIHRPPDVSCKDLVVDMIKYNWTQNASTYDLGGPIYGTRYLELWGHTTVRFDHVDWNAPDFHYLCDDPRPDRCYIEW